MHLIQHRKHPCKFVSVLGIYTRFHPRFIKPLQSRVFKTDNHLLSVSHNFTARKGQTYGMAQLGFSAVPSSGPRDGQVWGIDAFLATAAFKNSQLAQ